MAIAARFDLELLQFDIVNAFVNAPLLERVYMRLPPGYQKPWKVLRVNKALYGLRVLLLLWQKELGSTLTELGLELVASEPCCYTKKGTGVLIFFYVDDIAMLFPKWQAHVAQAIVAGIRRRYTLKGGTELRWFLGLEVLRDRPNRRIWLLQCAYISKISRLAEKEATIRAQTPISSTELLPREGLALPSEILVY